MYLESDHLSPISQHLASYETPYFLTVSLQQPLYRSSALDHTSLHCILKHSPQSHSINAQVVLLIKIHQWLPISQRKDQCPYDELCGTDVSDFKKEKSNTSILKVVLVCSPNNQGLHGLKFFDNPSCLCQLRTVRQLVHVVRKLTTQEFPYFTT